MPTTMADCFACCSTKINEVVSGDLKRRVQLHQQVCQAMSAYEAEQERSREPSDCRNCVFCVQACAAWPESVARACFIHHPCACALHCCICTGTP